LKKDIINFTFGFVCGVVLLYIMIQTTLEQMNMVIDKAYKLTIEMETRIQQDKVDKGEDLIIKPKKNKRII
tara:strand:+ start:1064 stop:1276 length:213 start_codon:yes stop_codon:yes gene_type:complete